MAQVPMAALAAAAAALAAAEPAPAVPQAAGSGGPTSRRDFYWLRSFLAGGKDPPPGPRAWVGKPGCWRVRARGRSDSPGLLLLQRPAGPLPQPLQPGLIPAMSQALVPKG